MADPSDMELLRDYHRQGSEAAFAGLVRRHINLVYSAALRRAGIAAHAEEITQAVFIILARKAASLRSDIILESWLHETTRLTALSFLRGERRRQFREQEAYMQSALQESADASTWNQLAPLLDDAVSQLGKKDRDAVMLRFFKEKNLREVAIALKTNEAAAQKRVLRAVEKLRNWFTRRGVVLPAAVVTAAISANSVQAAPVGLAVTISAAAVKGAAVAASVTTLVNGTIKTIFMTTIQKTVIAVAIVAAAGTGIYEARQASQLRERNQTLLEQQAPLAEKIGQLQRERDEAANRLSALADEIQRVKGNSTELLRLRGEVAQLRADSRRLSSLKPADINDPTQSAANLQPNPSADEASFKLESVVRQTQSRQGALACIRFAQDHQGQLPGDLEQLKTYLPNGGSAGTNWEIVSGGNLNTLRDPHKTILLREKEARQSPDGKFVKAYVFCDMTAELITSPNEDFSALEQQRGFLVHPAKN